MPQAKFGSPIATLHLCIHWLNTLLVDSSGIRDVPLFSRSQKNCIQFGKDAFRAVMATRSKQTTHVGYFFGSQFVMRGSWRYATDCGSSSATRLSKQRHVYFRPWAFHYRDKCCRAVCSSWSEECAILKAAVHERASKCSSVLQCLCVKNCICNKVCMDINICCEFSETEKDMKLKLKNWKRWNICCCVSVPACSSAVRMRFGFAWGCYRCAGDSRDCPRLLCWKCWYCAMTNENRCCDSCQYWAKWLCYAIRTYPPTKGDISIINQASVTTRIGFHPPWFVVALKNILYMSRICSYCA